MLLGRRAKLTVSRERPLCKKGRGAGAKGSCNWGWFTIGKKRRQVIVLHRNSSLRLHLGDWQRASVRVLTRPFSTKGKRFGAGGASVLVSAPSPRQSASSEPEQRYETRRLLSFDERHFRAVVPLQGGS